MQRSTKMFPNLPLSQRGTVQCLEIDSAVLKNNPWGDPSHRDVWVYTPPGYTPEQSYPVVVFLAGFAGTGEGMLARTLTEHSLATRCDRWMASGDCQPFIAVLPDCMTYLGGSQFVDSPAIGQYATHLMDEVLPFVAEHVSCNGKVGLTGRSSGGYGAVRLAMEYPGKVHAVACHAGDMGFETAFVGELTAALMPLHQAGSPLAFLESFWNKSRFSPNDFAAFNLLCMSAAYAPNEDIIDGLVTDVFPAHLPIDIETGEIHWANFEEWMAHDPLTLLEESEHQAALRDLAYFFVDVGRFDEYNLQFGARAFHARLDELEIAHIYEEFDGGHRGTTYRYDVSIPKMVEHLL